MAMIEKLFVQIFERKSWIIDQVDQQSRVLDQHLASKLLIDGITPPPWLFDSDHLRNRTSDNSDLNAEILISELLSRPGPAVPFSYSRCTVREDQVAESSRRGMSNGLGPEISAQKECFAEGDKESALIPNTVNDHCITSLGGHRDDDRCVTSPQDQRDTGISDVGHDLALSLARLQRSRSRQKALETRRSAKKVNSESAEDTNRSGFSGRANGSAIRSFQDYQIEEPGLADTLDTQNVKLGDSRSKEIGSGIDSGRITTSKSSAWHENLGSELASESRTGDQNQGETVARVGGKRKTASKSTGEKRITRSRSNMSQGPSSVELVPKSVHSNDHDRVITGSIFGTADGSLISRGTQTITGSSIETRRITRSRSNVPQDPSISVQSVNEKMITGSKFAAPNRSRSHKRTQLKEEGSSFIREEEEECAANSTDSSDKENVVEPSSVVEVTPNLFNSRDLGQRVTRSKSAASHKPLENKLSKRFEAIGGEKVSGVKGRASTLKEVEVDQVRSVEARTVSSGSELEVSVPCPGHSSIPVDPRQLDFNAMEPLDFNGTSSPALREEADCKLLEEDEEEEPLTLLESAGIVDNRGSNLEQRDDLSTEEDQQKVIFEASVENSDTSIEALSEHVVSPVKETPCSENLVVTHNLEHTEKCAEEKSSPGSIFCEAEIGLPRLAIPTEIASNDSEPENSEPIDCDFTKDTEDHEAVTDVGVELSCVEIKGESAVHVEPEHENFDISQRDNEDFCQSSRSQIVAKSVGKSSFGSSIDRLLTWSKQKLFDPQEEDVVVNQNSERRDSSREEKAVVDMDSDSRGLLSEEHSPKVILESEEDSEIPHEDVELLIAGRNQEEEMHRIGDENLLKGSESSPKSQFEEVREEKMQESSESLPKAQSEEVGEENIQEGFDSSPNSQFEELDQVEERNQIEEHNYREISESSPKLQFVEQADFSPKERYPSSSTPFTFNYVELDASLVPSIAKHSVGDTERHSVEEPREEDLTSIISNRDWQFIFDHNESLSVLEDKFGYGNGESSMIQEKKSDPTVTRNFFLDTDDTMPVHESFVFRSDNEQCCGADVESLNLPKTTIERAGILEQLCKSACMKTPLSYSSGLGKLYQSVPTGLLEGVDLKNKHPESDESGRAFQERTHSDSFQNILNSREWDVKKPCLSPVQKVWERIMSKSASTERKKSLNPELPCINEESESIDEVIANTHQCMDMDTIMGFSVKREPLAGINENVPISETEICLETRFSLDSVNTEFSFNGTQSKTKNNLENSKSVKRKYNNRNKENENMSLGAYSRDGNIRSLQKLINKQKLSSNAIPRKVGPVMEPKRSNIVSNISSFIPLVQQKQAAAITTGKRDVKVKALEAAEAVKQLAEKKENERKIKKEAMKLERARIEQENLKQLELQKKRKEEERKKKEAEMAAKKRQREEEEKKERERKRLRVEETRKQQRENEQKLQAAKEEKEKSRAMVERGRVIKESKSEKTNIGKVEKVKEDANLQRISEAEPSTTRPSTSKDRIGQEEFEASSDLLNNLKENMNAFSGTVQEPSYDISPYKTSDDEYEDFDDDDDDDRPKKFVPSWTSKKNVALVALSQDSQSPWEIFKPNSFCPISEVVLPRRFQI